jgi:hypothetical protein
MGGVGGASCTSVTDGEPEGDGKGEGGATSDWVIGGAGMVLARAFFRGGEELIRLMTERSGMDV